MHVNRHCLNVFEGIRCVQEFQNFFGNMHFVEGADKKKNRHIVRGIAQRFEQVLNFFGLNGIAFFGKFPLDFNEFAVMVQNENGILGIPNVLN